MSKNKSVLSVEVYRNAAQDAGATECERKVVGALLKAREVKGAGRDVELNASAVLKCLASAFNASMVEAAVAGLVRSGWIAERRHYSRDGEGKRVIASRTWRLTGRVDKAARLGAKALLTGLSAEDVVEL